MSFRSIFYLMMCLQFICYYLFFYFSFRVKIWYNVKKNVVNIRIKLIFYNIFDNNFAGAGFSNIPGKCENFVFIIKNLETGINVFKSKYQIIKNKNVCVPSTIFKKIIFLIKEKSMLIFTLVKNVPVNVRL